MPIEVTCKSEDTWPLLARRAFRLRGRCPEHHGGMHSAEDRVAPPTFFNPPVFGGAGRVSVPGCGACVGAARPSGIFAQGIAAAPTTSLTTEPELLARGGKHLHPSERQPDADLGSRSRLSRQRHCRLPD